MTELGMFIGKKVNTGIQRKEKEREGTKEMGNVKEVEAYTKTLNFMNLIFSEIGSHYHALSRK